MRSPWERGGAGKWGEKRTILSYFIVLDRSLFQRSFRYFSLGEPPSRSNFQVKARLCKFYCCTEIQFSRFLCVWFCVQNLCCNNSEHHHQEPCYSIQQKKKKKKKWTNPKKDTINSFFFNDNSRIIQEYFQAKIGRKIRIFSLAQKNNILILKRSVQK